MSVLMRYWGSSMGDDHSSPPYLALLSSSLISSGAVFVNMLHSLQSFLALCCFTPLLAYAQSQNVTSSVSAGTPHYHNGTTSSSTSETSSAQNTSTTTNTYSVSTNTGSTTSASVTDFGTGTSASSSHSLTHNTSMSQSTVGIGKSSSPGYSTSGSVSAASSGFETSVSTPTSQSSGTSGPFTSSNNTQVGGQGTSSSLSGTGVAPAGISYIGTFGTGTGTGAITSFPPSLTAVISGTTETFVEEIDSQYATITAPTSATVTYAYTAQNSQTSITAAGVVLGAGGVYYQGTNPGGLGGGIFPLPIIGPPGVDVGAAAGGGGGGGGKLSITRLFLIKRYMLTVIFKEAVAAAAAAVEAAVSTSCHEYSIQ